MRASIAIAALAVALPLAACSSTRTSTDGADTGGRGKSATSRSAMFNAATYTGAVAETPGTRGGGMGGTVSGTLAQGDLLLQDGSFVDVYGIQLNAGDQLTVDMNTTAFDPYLVVLTPDNQGFENDDFNGDRTHSRITITAGMAGPYAILATSYLPGATGNYTVTVDAPGEVVVIPPEALQ
jgi:hypothetical protein